MPGMGYSASISATISTDQPPCAMLELTRLYRPLGRP